MTWKLVSIQGRRSVPLPDGRPLTVGRSETCDLSIQDETVSRNHAEVEEAPGGAGVRVRDLGSTNGTFLNGDPISDAVAPAGARVAFGKVPFEVWGEGSDEIPAGATILRHVPFQGAANVAARLSQTSPGASLLRIGGQSLADRYKQKLELLIDIAKELSGQADVDRLLEQIVALTFQVMRVDRVAILMAGEDGALMPRISQHRDEQAGTWKVPSAIVRLVVEERTGLLIRDVPADLPASGTVLHHRVQSALAAPLLGSQGGLLGLIYLDNVAATHSFSEEDLEFLSAFSGMASVSIENSRLVVRAQREAVVLSNFQRYFAPDLVQQIAGHEGTVRLGGSKRRVVVLFSDIRGFTSLSEQMSPDGIANLLTEYFTVMVEIVFEHGGTLDKFIGDAVMALWGAPLAREDDADRAMRTAIAMQQGLARLNREWESQGKPALSIGIGINVGEVFAGNIGSERRLEYTVIGDAVNIASRLCAEAGPGEILIAEPLYRALADPPPVEPLEPMPLKGKAQAVPVYRVAEALV